MSEISKLEPRIVWKNFDDITRVPRPSKKEGKIISFLERFASTHDLEYKKDSVGNIMIRRKASSSMLSRPTIVVQSHMDMVCEKNADMDFDFEKEAIRTYVQDGWVRARGTTLGADDGIGMAAALALLTDTSQDYPSIEALFTVEEETGLSGASGLAKDMISGKYLINLDSEDEGEIFIGCAGGIDTIAEFKYKNEKTPANYVFFRIAVSGLLGGHSGDDIEKNRGNSNKILASILSEAEKLCEIRLSYFDGGNLRNAIPREAYAVFGVPKYNILSLFTLFESYSQVVRNKYAKAEPDFDITISEVPEVKEVIDLQTQGGLLTALNTVPNGVLKMSETMPDLVQTSTNLASVKFTQDNRITVTSSQRSSVNDERLHAAATVKDVFERAGAKVIHSDGYPGWEPDPDSKLLETAKSSYEKLFGKEPRIRAIHAGLECGLFLEKYPDLEMISIGPTLQGVHSPDERLEIESVEKFWKLLVDIIQNLK